MFHFLFFTFWDYLLDWRPCQPCKPVKYVLSVFSQSAVLKYPLLRQKVERSYTDNQSLEAAAIVRYLTKKYCKYLQFSKMYIVHHRFAAHITIEFHNSWLPITSQWLLNRENRWLYTIYWNWAKPIRVLEVVERLFHQIHHGTLQVFKPKLFSKQRDS